VDNRNTAGALVEVILLAPIVQTALGASNPFGQYGATLIAQSIARADGRFARLVDASLEAAP
jgi:hypothetical protein